MTFVLIVALALLAFLIAAFALRLPRHGWAMFGAALLFGLSGYALQGSPGLPAAPRYSVPELSEDNFAVIEARRDFFDPESVPARWVTVADAFTRNGKFEDAANMLGNAVQENPRDVEAWVALGNALVEHAGGSLTPPALYAYAQANRLDPDNAAAGYFLGLAYLRAGQPDRTREVWADLLANAPDDASWRDGLAAQAERLDRLLAQLSSQ